MIYPSSVLCWLGFISGAVGTVCVSSTSKEQKLYLTLSKIWSLTSGSWHCTTRKVMVRHDPSPDSMEWGIVASSHLMGCLAGGAASHRLSIESQAEVEENESPQMFAILCHWTQGEERAGWWRTQTPRNQTWQPQDGLGVVSEVVFEVWRLCALSAWGAAVTSPLTH